MKHVHDLETSSLSEEEKGKHSSYDPAEYIPCVHNASTETKTQQGASDSRDKGAGSSEAMVNDCVRCCRYLPAHYFDYVGGTSTGGLISIMLGRLRMSVDDCMREYETLSETIFGHPRRASVRGPIFWPRDKYDGDRIQKAVEDVISRRMSQAERKAGAGNFNSPPGLCRT